MIPGAARTAHSSISSSFGTFNGSLSGGSEGAVGSTGRPYWMNGGVRGDFGASFKRGGGEGDSTRRSYKANGGVRGDGGGVRFSAAQLNGNFSGAR